MNQYQEPSTPELADLQQEEETDGYVVLPVRVTDQGPVQVHQLPSRDASMRSLHVGTEVQQIVGANLRRRKMIVWATAETASTFVYIGTDKNQVENGTAALLPAHLDDFTNGAPTQLTMTHAMQVWVRAAGVNPVTLSVVTEDWAD